MLYFGASDGVLKHMFALGYRLPAFKSWTELIEVNIVHDGICFADSKHVRLFFAKCCNTHKFTILGLVIFISYVQLLLLCVVFCLFVGIDYVRVPFAHRRRSAGSPTSSSSRNARR